jgi:hypothetical protein
MLNRHGFNLINRTADNIAEDSSEYNDAGAIHAPDTSKRKRHD